MNSLNLLSQHSSYTGPYLYITRRLNDRYGKTNSEHRSRVCKWNNKKKFHMSIEYMWKYGYYLQTIMEESIQ